MGGVVCLYSSHGVAPPSERGGEDYFPRRVTAKASRGWVQTFEPSKFEPETQVSSARRASDYKHLVAPRMQKPRKAAAGTTGTGDGKGRLRQLKRAARRTDCRSLEKQTKQRNALKLSFIHRIQRMPCHLTVTKEERGRVKPEDAVSRET